MYIASVATTIKFHEFPNGNIIHNYQPGKVEGPIKSISWSRDGNWLVVVPHSGHTEIVSTKDQLKLLKTIHEVDEPTAACFKNTTKKHVGIGTKSGLVLIYDIKSRNVKKRFTRASTQVTHVAFSAKDTHCIAGCKNGEVLVYNNVTNSPPGNLRVPKSNSVSCLKTNQLKRNLVLGGSNEGVVVVWDINNSRSTFCTEAHKASVNSVAFSPVSSDLIVTAGSDRQFSFYDIVEKKCIANVPVENNITAVDFSPDGTYFVVASQNGRVCVYDSRNIHEPVHSFAAHKSSIKYITFQNINESRDSSVCSISKSVENSACLPVEDAKKGARRSVRVSDFFGMYVHTVDGALETKSVGSIEGGDSFIAALGLNKTNASESNIHDDVFYNADVSRLPSIHDAEFPTPNSMQLGKAEASHCKPKQFSSTPKLQCTKPEMSPTVVQKVLPTTASTSDIKSVVKECFNDEFQSVVNDLKNDIKFQATHTTYQLRAMLLDMQMAMVKEFIKVENFNNKLREDMLPNSKYEASLVEENEKLRKRIDFLEERLKNLTAEKVSGE